MKLRYNRIASLVCIALYSNIAKNITVSQQTIELDFYDYVLGNIHLNYTRDYDIERDVREYIKAYGFLIGRNNDIKTVKKVLEWFYSDMIQFLLNNKKVIYLKLTTNNLEKLIKSTNEPVATITNQNFIKTQQILYSLYGKYINTIDIVNEPLNLKFLQQNNSIIDDNFELEKAYNNLINQHEEYKLINNIESEHLQNMFDSYVQAIMYNKILLSKNLVIKNEIDYSKIGGQQ